MAKSDGTVYINTLVDTKGFGKGMSTIQKQMGGLSGAIGKLGAVIASTFAVGKLVQFGKEAIELGSDLQEVQNVVDVTFTSMSDKVNEFAKGAAEAAGLSETMAKKYVGTFGAMAKAFGFAEGEAFNMSTSLTQLAGDVASFYNLTQDEAYTKLKSVFTGETETLKDLGVVMTQSALDAYAMSEGYGKTTKQMSEQEKVALRYSFVLDQLSAAQGDFARTSDSWANQTRILSLNFDSFKANIGQALINIFTPFLKVINQIVSKMAQLSSHFVAFSEMLVGKQTSGGGGSPGELLEEVADGYGEVEDAAKGAEKAQKKYLSGLDEIRTFTEDSDSGTSTVGGGIDFSGISDSIGDIQESDTAVSKLIERVKKLADLFKEGFKEGLGDTASRLQSLKKSVESIKDSFSFIFNEDLANGFNDTLDKVVKSAGVIAGAFTSIGLTLATNLLGGFSGFLDSEKENIQQYLLDMFDIAGRISEKAGEFSDAFAYIFEVLANENGQKLTENIIAIFANAFMDVTRLAGEMRADLLSFIVDPFVESKEELRKAFDDILKGLSDLTGEVRVILDELFGMISEVYEKYIAPVFEKLMPEVEKLYKEHIAPLVSRLGEFFSEVADNLNVLWNDLFKPLIQWIIDNILPVITPILQSLGERAMILLSTITDVISGAIDVISGIITFLTGVFTGDWERAWSGIEMIIDGVINRCTSLIEGFINTVISKINGVIGAINSFSLTNGLLNFFGIDSIPTIPEVSIPMLATGAVIPPNAPFMAVLGDQKHGTNIEAPLDTIKQAVREVVGNSGGGQYAFTAQINRRTLFEEMIDEAKLRQSTSGRNPFELA